MKFFSKLTFHVTSSFFVLIKCNVPFLLRLLSEKSTFVSIYYTDNLNKVKQLLCENSFYIFDGRINNNMSYNSLQIYCIFVAKNSCYLLTIFDLVGEKSLKSDDILLSSLLRSFLQNANSRIKFRERMRMLMSRQLISL